MSSKEFTKVVSETLERAGFRYNDKLILAFSGGRDSVALALTLKALNFNPLLAHVNYGLRGEESLRDEQFVVDFSRKNSFECEVLNATLTEEEKKEILFRLFAERFGTIGSHN